MTKFKIRLRRELLTSRVAIRKLDLSKNASDEFQVISYQLDQLQHQSSLIIQDFSETSKQMGGQCTKVHMVKLLLASFTTELANMETKIEVLGDAHAVAEHDVEQLSLYKEDIDVDATHM